MSFDAFWEMRNRSLPVHDPEALARAVWDHCQQRAERAEPARCIADLERQLAEARSENEELRLGLNAKEAGKDRLRAERSSITQERNRIARERDQLRAANDEQAKEIERLRADLTAVTEECGRMKEACRAALKFINRNECVLNWSGGPELKNEIRNALVHRAALAKEDKQPEPPRYSAEELRKWWPAKCSECGWRGLSRDASGGGPIADTGDYDDVTCPKCSAFVEGDDEAEQKGAQP